MNVGKSSAPRSSSSFLPKIDENTINVEFDVKCQYLEIYNENIIDLLDPTQPKV
jgi:hypothetical protein